MSEPKTNCTACGAEFLQATADRTGGICMPCLQKQHREAAFANPYPVAIPVANTCLLDGVRHHHEAVMHTTAQLLLEESNLIGPRIQIVRLIKPLSFAILSRTPPSIPSGAEEHLKRVTLALLDQCKAEMETGGVRYTNTELQQEAWSGGFLYKNGRGDVVFSMNN